MKSTLQIVAVTILAVTGAIGYHAFQADQDARAEAATAAWQAVHNTAADTIHTNNEEREAVQARIRQLQKGGR